MTEEQIEKLHELEYRIDKYSNKLNQLGQYTKQIDLLKTNFDNIFNPEAEFNSTNMEIDILVDNARRNFRIDDFKTMADILNITESYINGYIKNCETIIEQSKQQIAEL